MPVICKHKTVQLFLWHGLEKQVPSSRKLEAAQKSRPVFWAFHGDSGMSSFVRHKGSGVRQQGHFSCQQQSMDLLR